jgi:hypothetical protein
VCQVLGRRRRIYYHRLVCSQSTTRKTTTLGSWLHRILGLLSTPNLHPELPVFANDTIPVSPITTSNTVTVICPAPAPSALAVIAPQGLPTITLRAPPKTPLSSRSMNRFKTTSTLSKSTTTSLSHMLSRLRHHPGGWYQTRFRSESCRHQAR